MKTKFLLLALVATFGSQPSTPLHATTVDAANHYAYAANLGWVDWAGDTTNGAVIGEYGCSGYLYAANVGWINLGSGTPTNGIWYQNLSAGDFGVNQDGSGNLRGYAWGANIGWIAFETNGAPKVDLYTGNFSGSIWSANCGWISLSNAVAYVQTDTIRPGPLAPDGLPIAWLLQNFGTTNVNANADPDGDGLSNQQEYLAGTDPNDASSDLRITSITRGLAGDPTRVGLDWTANSTRAYAVQHCAALGGTNAWSDAYIDPWMGLNSITFDDSSTNAFYRIRAFRPLLR